jgi:predicted transcriptional regulator
MSTPTRAARLAKIRALKAKGLTSPQIGKELGLAPSTVRDYLNDPERSSARKRQLRYAVEPGLPLNGGEIVALHPSAKFTPHKGKGRVHNAARRRQAQAIIGWGARR